MRSPNVIVLVWTVLVLCLASGHPARALPPEVEKARHKDIKVHEIRSDDKKSFDLIWQLRQNPDLVQIIRVQAGRQEFELDQLRALDAWVKSGKCLEIVTQVTDAAVFVGEYWGIHGFTAAVGGDQVGPISAEHPLLTSVGLVQYKCVDYFLAPYFEGEGVVPLLGRNRKGDQPITWAIFAAKEVGRGRIVCRPEFRTDLLDGARLQVNLLEWEAGYPVPGSAAAVGPAPVPAPIPQPALDTIVLKNGDRLSGTIATEAFGLKTSYAVLSFSCDKMARVELEGAGANTDRVQLRVGDTLSGVVTTDKVEVELTTGAAVTLDKDKIKEIVFSEAAHK